MLSHAISMLAVSTGGAIGSVVLLLGLLIFILVVFYVVCLAKIFTKAGRPAWAAVVPFYGSWVYYEIGGKPGWLILIAVLSFIPVLGIIASIALLVISVIVDLEVAKRFDRSPVFAIFLLFLLPFIGLPILAFGKSQYHAPLKDGTVPPSPQGSTPPQPIATPPSAGISPTVSPDATAPAPPVAPTPLTPPTPPAPPEVQPPSVPPQPPETPAPPSPIQ